MKVLFDERAEGRLVSLQLAELLGALSYALDMTEGQPPGHCLRACWIATRVGMALRRNPQEIRAIYFAAMLKDLGCSSNAARICELYLTDDISFKRDFKTIDGSLSAALRFVLAKTGLKSGLTERIRAIVNILQNGGEISRSLIETRCDRGAEIAGALRFSEDVQTGIRSLDEHWDGTGKPDGLIGSAIPESANIALLAQVADVFHHEQGVEAALMEIRRRSGTWFAPYIVDAFFEAQSASDFWTRFDDPKFEEAVYSMPPALYSVPVDEDYLDEVAEAFAKIVDAKTPYTANHSQRVTFYADMIAAELGLSLPHRRWLGRAALLHDIGKLAVSNQILDKPGKLDDAEWVAVKRHAALGEQILEKVSAFADIAPLAGAHHERLDGKGYPRGLMGSEISLEARILTVADVFDALSAERPYRAAMPMSKALAIMDAEVGTAFDKASVSALKAGLARLETDEVVRTATAA